MNPDLYYLWNKAIYLFVKHINIWVIICFFATAPALWYLAGVLEKHNAPRNKEIALARKTAAAYTAAAVLLWLFNVIMS